MDFRRYKLQLRNILSNVSTVLQPLNLSRTIQVSYGSCFRTPTFLFEPYFIWSFGPPASEHTLEEMKEVCASLRDSSKQAYSLHSPDPVLNSVKFAITLDTVRQLLGLSGTSFKPLELYNAAELAAKPTSSGFPDYKKKTEIVEQVLDQANLLYHERDGSFIDLPVTLAWRTQVRKSGIKYRLIWLVPFIVILYEMALFTPMITYIQNLQYTSYCIGNVFEQLSVRYQRLQNYKYIYSLDYESYDSTITPFFLNLFFSFCKEHLRLTPGKNWLFEKIREFHLNALVITGSEGEARIFRKRNGLLSGSVVTNFLGSFVNLFLICYFLIDHDINPVEGQISVMGDDCLFGLNEKFSLGYITDYFKKKFGIRVSINKSEVYSQGEPVFFLGALIDANKRYINIELIREQLKISTSFNYELSEFDRVFSKLCSSLFKYTDGWMYFVDELSKIKEYFNVTETPIYYEDVSTPAGGPIYEHKLRSVDAMMYQGWRLQ